MTIKRIWIFAAAAFIAGAAVVTAVIASSKPESLPLDAPAELANARLIYQRSDGIYLRTPGARSAKKLVGNGTHPRWSPDGDSFAFIRGQQVMLYDGDTKKERAVATAKKLRAVAFHPNGKEIWFIDGETIGSVRLDGGAVTERLRGSDFRELDIAIDGSFLAVTVKRLVGYRVEIFPLPSGNENVVARGCSASISPDGKYVTVNTGDHTKLSLRDRASGKEWQSIHAPDSIKLDDQHWSNHPAWIVSTSEGAQRSVFVHRVDDGKSWRITPESDCRRPDLFID